MASAYKRGDKWYARYREWKRDNEGNYLKNSKGQSISHWKSAVGCNNKRDTEAAARRLEDEAYNRMVGNAPALPTEPTAIKESLRAYEAHLTDARNTTKYVDLVIRRLEVAFETLGITTMADVSKIKENLPAFLSAMKDGTANHYKRAIKGFLRFHKLFETASDFKLHKVQDGEQRRSLDEKELQALYKAAETSPKLVQGLTGRERAMLYRVAAGTGFRAGELRSLRPSSFRLADKPMAYLPASATKNGDEVYQPLPSSLAKALREWLPKSTDNELWPTNWHLKAAKMIRVDLATANIEPETAEGVVNFHSLRVSYCTSLARNGVSPTIAQQLMRHSTIQLTLETYTKFTSDEVADAVDKLA